MSNQIKLDFTWGTLHFSQQEIRNAVHLQGSLDFATVLHLITDRHTNSAFCKQIPRRKPREQILRQLSEWVYKESMQKRQEEALLDLLMNQAEDSSSEDAKQVVQDIQRQPIKKISQQQIEEDKKQPLTLLQRLASSQSLKETQKILRESGCWEEYDAKLVSYKEIKEDRIDDNALLEQWIEELTQDPHLNQ